MKRIAVVTGSTRGIGRGIADALRENGYLTIYSGTSADRREDIPEDCPYIGCDIGKAEDRARLVDEVTRRYGRIDVWVNNAGVAPTERRDMLDMSEESFDRVISINLKGTFFLSQAVAKAMLAMQGQSLPEYAPRIINITSISAYTASINRAEYCLSKAGLHMASDLFAARLAGEGIKVFEIRPGIIQTDMTQGVHEKYQSMIDEGLTPIQRFGRPSDVANMVLAACSGLLDFTSGQVLNADGGYHLRRL